MALDRDERKELAIVAVKAAALRNTADNATLGTVTLAENLYKFMEQKIEDSRAR